MRLFHGTANPLPIGTVLTADGRPRNYADDVYRTPGMVSLADRPGTSYFYAVFGAFSRADFFAEPRVYEVEAANARETPGEWVAPEATIVRDVTREAVAAFRAEWERTWKPTILSSDSGGLPTPAMIVAEFESRMKRHATKESAVTDQPTEKQQPTGEAAEAVRFGIVDCSDPEKALQQLLTLDSDNDGVPNYRDKAPFDPKVSVFDIRLDPHGTGLSVAVPGDPQVREAATFNRTPQKPTKPANSWDKDVMHAVTKNGGFTFRDVMGDGPKKGYMVSVAKHTETKVPLRDLTSAHVADYMTTHQQELKDPNNYLGGWVYKGNVYLDISRHTEDRNEAMRLARANKQLGIYDIGNGETVMTEAEQAAQRAAFLTARGSVDPADFVNSLRAQAGLEPLASDAPPTAIQRAALRSVSEGYRSAGDEEDRS